MYTPGGGEVKTITQLCALRGGDNSVVRTPRERVNDHNSVIYTLRGGELKTTTQLCVLRGGELKNITK